MVNAEPFETEQTGVVVVARLHTADVRPEQMQELVDACLDHLRYDHAHHVLLDLACVEYLTSACLLPLISLLQHLEHIRGRLGLFHCQHQISTMFRLTRLDAVLGLFDDEKAALESL